MDQPVNLQNIYMPSDDIVAREIEGEIIIVPLVSGIGDLEDELFTLNLTGRAIWGKLDGKKTLSDIVNDLLVEFDASQLEIEKNVLGFISELYRRKIIIETE